MSSISTIYSQKQMKKRKLIHEQTKKRKREIDDDTATAGDQLPELCVANTLSFTSPPDASRFSVVSQNFRSAAASNLVWERFLPPDYQQIISESVSSGSSSSSSLNILSKQTKDLYIHLCDNPILIANGNMSFSIDKLSGKKCYMLGARELSITWGDTPHYWKWISSTESPFLPQSRFSEVALLLNVCWLDIGGRIETKILSPNTKYGAYLIYTIWEPSKNLDNGPVRLFVRCNGDRGYPTEAYLKSGTSRDMGEGQNQRIPFMRTDGWMEIEIGEFFNDHVDDVVEMRLMETDNYRWKSGLVVHGIELRPK